MPVPLYSFNSGGVQYSYEAMYGNYTIANITGVSAGNINNLTFPTEHVLTNSDTFGSPNTVGSTISIQGIANNAFVNRININSVTISSRIQIIGDQAFSSCTYLSTLMFSEGGPNLQSIGALAFSNCPITSIVIPRTLTTIGDGAFQYCGALSSVTFAPNSLCTNIGWTVFTNTAIRSISIPSNVTTIGPNAFTGIPNLVAVVFESGNQSINMAGNTFNSSSLNGKTIYISYWTAYHATLNGQSTSFTSPSIGPVSFFGATNVTLAPTFKPTTKTVLQNAVNDWCNGSPSTPHISLWDTSLITDMSNLFESQANFNDDISGWDTSNVTNMYQMFYNAPVFNQDIGDWNTSNVTDMGLMFMYAHAFDQDIGSWDTTDVTNMSQMFYDARVFNQDIGTKEVTVNGVTYTAWDVSSVETANSMFNSASVFNNNGSGSIGNWRLDPTKLTDISYMFAYATAFNQDIRYWNLVGPPYASVNNMFYNANAFNNTYNGSIGYNNGTPLATFFNQFTDNGITYYFTEDSNNVVTITSAVLASNGSTLGSGWLSIPSSFTVAGVVHPIRHIGNNAFESSGITSITIPASVTEIGIYAFYLCSSLASVNFAAGSLLVSIGNSAFSSSGITSVTIPASVTSIGGNVFNGTTSLATVVLPSTNGLGLTSPSNGPVSFYGASGVNIISGIYTDSGVSYKYSIKPGTTTDVIITGTTMGTALSGSIVIPSTFAISSTTYSVKEIGVSAFQGTAISSITIPTSVTSIGNEVFYLATSLTTVTFATNSQLATIGANAFIGTAIISVTIPASATFIAGSAFNGVTSLATVVLPSTNGLGLTSPSTVAVSFYGATGVNIIPGIYTVNSVSYNYSIKPGTTTDVIITGTTEGTALTGSIVIPSTFAISSTTYSVKEIGVSAFQGTAISSITIPLNVTSIGVNAFNGTTSLATVVLPTTNGLGLTSPSTVAVSFYGATGVNIISGMSSPTAITFPGGSAGGLTTTNLVTVSGLTTISAVKLLYSTNSGTSFIEVTLNGVGSYSFTIPDGSYTYLAGVAGVLQIIAIDTLGNKSNTVSNPVSFVVDTTPPPVVSFTISDNSLTVGETATVTLTFSESVTGFSSNDDITAQNGTLSVMESSEAGKIWTGTFTPSINLESLSNVLTLAATYTDIAGNSGPSATSDPYDIDTLAPTVSSFTISDNSLTVGETATVTLTFSETVTDFSSAADITAQNGILTGMTSNNDITWTGTFTPSISLESLSNVLTLSTNYTDLAGNSGPSATSPNYAIDTLLTDNGVSYTYTIKPGTTTDVIITGTTAGTSLSGDIVIPSTFAISGTVYSVKEIGTDAFQSTAIISITIPASVTSISGNAFNGTTSLATVVLPTTNGLSLTSPSTGPVSFYGATGVNIISRIDSSTVTFPTSPTSNGTVVVTAGDGAVSWEYSTNSGTSWTSGSNTTFEFVLSPGTYAVGAVQVRNTDASGNVSVPISNTGVIGIIVPISISNGGNTITFYGGISDTLVGATSQLNVYPSATTVVIDGYGSIGANAFENATTVTSVTIPSSVTSIGTKAFYNIQTLSSVFIPAAGITYGGNAFQNTGRDMIVTVLGLSTSLEMSNWKTSYATYFVTSTPSIKVMFVTETGYITVHTILGVKYIVVKIGTDPYVRIGDDSSMHGNGVSGFQPSIITIPSQITIDSDVYTVTKIGNNAFRGMSVTGVTIPNTVTHIGNYAFDSTHLGEGTNILSLTAPLVFEEDSVCESIGSFAFHKAYTRTGAIRFRVEIPESVLTIGVSAFRDNPLLKEVSLFQTRTVVNANAFKLLAYIPRVLVRNTETWDILNSWIEDNTANFSASGNTDVRFIGYFNGINWSNICFPAGTPVMTDQGDVAIDKLNINKHTLRGARIVAITRTITEDECLIRFEPNSLYVNVPSIRTEMTCEHQIFYQGRMVHAVNLASMKSLKRYVYKVPYNGAVLFNVLLDVHGKMMINNLIAETLHPNNGMAKLTRALLAITDDDERLDLACNYNMGAKELGVFTKIKHRL